MKYLIFLFVLSLSATAQIEIWSEPQLLTDTIGSNYSPNFVRDLYDIGWIEYNRMVWIRVVGDSSYVMCRSMNDSFSEIIVERQGGDVQFSNPTISTQNYSTTDFMVIWESDQNGNVDLFARFYQNDVPGEKLQVTDHPGDDVDPDAQAASVAWSRNGNIFFRAYSNLDSTWTEEIVLDSINCSHPVLSYNEVIYRKGDQIYCREYNFHNWQTPFQLSHGGVNRNPVVSTGDWEFGVFWEHRESGNWRIMGWNYLTTDTMTYFSSSNNCLNPTGFGVAVVTKDDWDGGVFLAFESDSSSFTDIMVNKNMWTGQFQNITQSNEPEQNPVLSSAGLSEASGNNVRVWLAWEKEVNGKMQIWGSHLDMSNGSVQGEEFNAPFNFILYQNLPNPFNPLTHIKYSLPKTENVELTDYDLQGREIKTMVEGKQSAGSHQVEWDGRDESGQLVASGVYVYKLQAGTLVQSRKMVLLR